MASALPGLLSQSKWLAQQRKQRPTTAHLLMALFQSSAAAPLLVAQGVTELGLVDVLARDKSQEPATALGIAGERAQRLARSLGQVAVHELHVLCALLRDPRSAAFAALDQLRVPIGALEHEVLHTLLASSTPAQTKRPSRLVRAPAPAAARSRKLPLSLQQELAAETESRRAQLRRDRGQASDAPDAQPRDAQLEQGATPQAAHAEPAASSLEVSPDAAHGTARASRSMRVAAKPQPTTDAAALELEPKRFPLLCSLGRNLSLQAASHRMDPVLGRDAEIEQVLDVLSRRRARNPVLVGQPGVGKTAVVDGVAQALIAAGDARILIEIPSSALLSGTGVRGALSERLQGLLREVTESAGRVVLFIDEIHTVLGTDDGADSIAGGLKTALARGELACIGATTEAEHRRVFERDAALARRFTRIDVQEPARDVALAILEGLAPEYEQHHSVRYSADALVAAVDLSVRFMAERRLPDKAIGLLDQAAARVRRRGGRRVERASVAEVVSEHCGVPLERLMMRDGEVLLALEEHLGRRVIGQTHAASAIADAMRKGAAGFRGRRPLCTLLFLGPTGVGKTEMAKALADLMFPGGAMTRIDMSELSEPHGIARLLGAPPGYLGHEEGGQLTEAVRARPYQLVLLDEIEKAHRDVLLALLPLLDEGRLTDGRGRTVDFTNTVIVMTSNLGVEALVEKRSVGFGSPAAAPTVDRRTRVLSAAQRAVPPELWNRIDEPLCFDSLSRDDLLQVAQLLLADTARMAAQEHGIALEVDASALHVLVDAGFDPQLGARPMRRAVSRLVEAELARAMLSGLARHGDTIRLCGENGRVVMRGREAAVDAAE